MRNAPRLLITTALAAPLAALALAGCATAPTGGTVAAAPATTTQPLPPGESSASNYGLFLAGEAALQAGHSAQAEQYFSRAAQGAGDQPAATQALIREKAFTAAVMAGDIDAAAALGPTPDPASTEPVQRLARLVRAVDALAENRGKEADAILTAPGGGSTFDVGFVLLKPWAAAAAGDPKRAVALPEGPTPALTRVSAQFDQAQLLERDKRFDEAETDYKSLTSGQFAALYIVPYGEFLQRRGRAKEAEVLYKSALERQSNSREFKRALARLQSRHSPPPLPTLKQGAAQAMTSAAEMSLIQKRFTDGEIFLHLALRLDPQEEEAWVFLGDILAQADDQDAARAAYAHVPQTSPDWIDARQRIISSYESQGDIDTALRLAQELIKVTPGDRESLIVEADLLRSANRFPEAVAVLDKVIAADATMADWVLYYQRGTALDRAGRWPEAEQDLVKALSLRPDQPDVLNYLGYSWVTRGEKLPQAMAMLQKAYLAQPDSGEIADSVGWAYYNLGDFKSAVQRLERAVSLEPINAEINDHLGDAYWRAGRQTEARYQWNRVLTLSPSGDLRTAVERKLASGLEIKPAATRS
jgi:Flp pilus assembly protein TadD